MNDCYAIALHEQWIFHTDKMRLTGEIIYNDLYFEGNQ